MEQMPEFTLSKGFAGGQADAVPATFVKRNRNRHYHKRPASAARWRRQMQTRAVSATGFLGIASGTAEKREWVAGESVRIMTIGSVFILQPQPRPLAQK